MAFGLRSLGGGVSAVEESDRSSILALAELAKMVLNTIHSDEGIFINRSDIAPSTSGSLIYIVTTSITLATISLALRAFPFQMILGPACMTFSSVAILLRRILR